MIHTPEQREFCMINHHNLQTETRTCGASEASVSNISGSVRQRYRSMPWWS